MPNNRNERQTNFRNEEEEIVFEEEQNQEQDVEEEDAEYEDSDEEDLPLEIDEPEEEESNPTLRQSERYQVPIQRYQHLQTTQEQTEEYSIDNAHVIAMTMSFLMNNLAGMSDDETCSFIQT